MRAENLHLQIVAELSRFFLARKSSTTAQHSGDDHLKCCSLEVFILEMLDTFALVSVRESEG